MKALHKLRRCIVSRESYPAYKMVRFVLSPDGDLVPDLRGRLPGRGCWVEARRERVDEAVRKKLFNRFAAKVAQTRQRDDRAQDIDDVGGDIAPGSKLTLTIPEGLSDSVERMLRQRCLELLGLVRQSGQMVMGFEKVRSALQATMAPVLLTASDGADDGRRKLCQGIENLRVIDIFTRTELSQALGRENAVHIALTSGHATNRFIHELERLQGFRNLAADED
ncbi:MAG: DNA-binding protein [Kordiimonas sp.]|nr:DNA-binding protein [Kordiimonas sp.]|tara:strand:+ start:403 stop:1071 length:669 start_codon:yes stop_codon:yes gene_type:complete